VYVPQGSTLFPTQSMLVSEYTANNIATYTLDANGNPVLASRQTFISGLAGAESAAIDPVTGDFFFSTFGGSNQVIEVQGFSTPAPAATSEVPTLSMTATVLAAMLVLLSGLLLVGGRRGFKR
jgi:hypothetical protein